MAKSFLSEAFWACVEKQADGCWVWKRGRIPRGYGMVAVNGRKRLAHRMAWELSSGPIPDGLFVCHVCDNPPCVNPEHLFLGTPRDNTIDSVRKGRWVRRRLDYAAIASDRRAGATQSEIAKKFGVTQAGISRALKRIAHGS